VSLAHMNKATFSDHLAKATSHSFDFAKRYVRNQLPESIRYLVRLNQSFDGNPLAQGEHVFPDDVARHGARICPLSAEQVVELLWRDGLVPEWIDISVESTDGTNCFMQLLCCGRFSEQAEHLYYSKTDVCPFGCKSPPMPLDWKAGDEPFDLHWRVDRDT
jgi:hypothetical protein